MANNGWISNYDPLKNFAETYEHHYFRKFYPCLLHGMQSSAIQSTTASAVCAVVDYLMHHIESYQGRVYQEQIPFALIQNNRFGKIFA